MRVRPAIFAAQLGIRHRQLPTALPASAAALIVDIPRAAIRTEFWLERAIAPARSSCSHFIFLDRESQSLEHKAAPLFFNLAGRRDQMSSTSAATE
jgi:hypothetical protein